MFFFFEGWFSASERSKGRPQREARFEARVKSDSIRVPRRKRFGSNGFIGVAAHLRVYGIRPWVWENLFTGTAAY